MFGSRISCRKRSAGISAACSYEKAKENVPAFGFGGLGACRVFFCNATALSSERQVAALDWAPVLNTPDMRSVFGGSDGRTLLTDEKGAVRALEFIAFPGTVFRVFDEQTVRGVQMYRVQTAEYPYSGDAGYFIPAEFTREVPGGVSQRTVRLPEAQEVLARMRSWEGLPYVWGGNTVMGAVGVLDYFRVRPEDPPGLLDQWMLKGMDCSGLLFAATDGWTPRNTSALVRYGDPLEIQGKKRSGDRFKFEAAGFDRLGWARGHCSG
jgi:hypothetical protein